MVGTSMVIKAVTVQKDIKKAHQILTMELSGIVLQLNNMIRDSFLYGLLCPNLRACIQLFGHLLLQLELRLSSTTEADASSMFCLLFELQHL